MRFFLRVVYILFVFRLRNDENLSFCHAMVISTTRSISHIPVQTMPLRQNDPSSSWCFVSKTMPTETAHVKGVGMEVGKAENEHETGKISFGYENFLATQVWPAARAAAMALEQFVFKKEESEEGMDEVRSICEFGCGPGLPSVTACTAHNSYLSKVIATDIDPFALQLVAQAVGEQVQQSKAPRNPKLSMQLFDLTDEDATPPRADLYILSDVFESGHVAKGAAFHTMKILLEDNPHESDEKDGAFGSSRSGKCNTQLPSQVWVFAQSDRAQRDLYLREIQQLLSLNAICDATTAQMLSWTPLKDGPICGRSTGILDRLWLCDVDELKVDY
jgi:hypothetical protein